jgi:hypothetical protein
MTSIVCACIPPAEPTQGDEPAAAGGRKTIPCALGGADAFADCTVEDTGAKDMPLWIVRHPDGGFRRFRIIDGATRIATADGADEVETERIGAELEVRVGKDRYRFPAAPPETPVASEAPSDAANP